MAMNAISQTQDRTVTERKPNMQTRHTDTNPLARSTAPTANRTPERANEKRSEKSIEFILKMPQAQSACLAGTFNGWDSKKTPMRKDGSARWKATVPLAPGRHEYRFVVDGQWISDPNARESVKNQFGSTNSVVVV
jgi:1,4-alpha-glucan branching enzyme